MLQATARRLVLNRCYLFGIRTQVRDRTDALDGLGNTTAATGKGFAIGSAVLTSLALLSAFQQQVCNVGRPRGEALRNVVKNANFSSARFLLALKQRHVGSMVGKDRSTVPHVKRTACSHDGDTAHDSHLRREYWHRTSWRVV